MTLLFSLFRVRIYFCRLLRCRSLHAPAPALAAAIAALAPPPPATPFPLPPSALPALSAAFASAAGSLPDDAFAAAVASLGRLGAPLTPPLAAALEWETMRRCEARAHGGPHVPAESLADLLWGLGALGVVPDAGAAARVDAWVRASIGSGAHRDEKTGGQGRGAETGSVSLETSVSSGEGREGAGQMSHVGCPGDHGQGGGGARTSTLASLHYPAIPLFASARELPGSAPPAARLCAAAWRFLGPGLSRATREAFAGAIAAALPSAPPADAAALLTALAAVDVDGRGAGAALRDEVLRREWAFGSASEWPSAVELLGVLGARGVAGSDAAVVAVLMRSVEQASGAGKRRSSQ